MPKNKIVSTTTFNGHPVISAVNHSYNYSERYLKNNQELLDSTVDRHNKVFCFRMDLRFPVNHPEDNSNEAFKRCMSTYTKDLSRQGLDPQYVAKREQVSSNHHHYHVHVLVNGNKRKDCRRLIDEMVPHWSRAINVDEKSAESLINRCDKTRDGKPQKNGTMIRRSSPNFDEKYDQVFKQMSYLAKDNDRDITPAGTKKICYSKFRRERSRSTK